MFSFPTMVEKSDENLGQLLMVIGSRDEAILGAINTLATTQGASGEATEDEDEDMVCEDGHFIPHVRGLLLHLDEDLVERGRRWKRQRCRLNHRRSDCGDVFVSLLIIRWKLDSYSDE